MEKSEFKLTLSEYIFILAGILFFTSTIFIASGGNYLFLLGAKIIYGAGVIILIAGK